MAGDGGRAANAAAGVPGAGVAAVPGSGRGGQFGSAADEPAAVRGPGVAASGGRAIAGVGGVYAARAGLAIAFATWITHLRPEGLIAGSGGCSGPPKRWATRRDPHRIGRAQAIAASRHFVIGLVGPAAKTVHSAASLVDGFAGFVPTGTVQCTTSRWPP